MHDQDSTGRRDRLTTLMLVDEHGFEPCGPEEGDEVEAEVRRLLDVDGILGTGLGVAELN